MVPPVAAYCNLVDLRGGVREFLGQLAVVGEEQQAGGGAVQSSHRVYALGAAAVHEHHDGAALLRVVGGGDEAFGLVEQEVAVALAAELLAAILHIVAGHDHVAHLGDHLAVDLHAAGGDEFVGLATRADAGMGDVFVQAHRTLGVFLLGFLRSGLFSSRCAEVHGAASPLPCPARVRGAGFYRSAHFAGGGSLLSGRFARFCRRRLPCFMVFAGGGWLSAPRCFVVVFLYHVLFAFLSNH